jgi:signal transduction histidine kinase
LGGHAKLRIEAAAGDAQIPVAAIDLERILINLVANASGALIGEGLIRVCTANRTVDSSTVNARGGPLTPGRYVQICVSDNGHGIPDAVLPHLFQPFFSTKGEQGTGLGLFSVAQIASAAGGDVAVDTRPGEGTRVCVYLPRVTEGTLARLNG